MAEGKKSFTAYCDWGEVFDEMSDEEAGKLVKHLFDYVRDKEPVTDNRLIKLSFIQIKATLKRDLEKWKQKQTMNRENGKLGGRPKKTQSNQTVIEKTERLKKEPKKGVTVTVSDSVSDNVSVNEQISVCEISKPEFLNLWNQIRKDILKKPSNLNRIPFGEDLNLKGYNKSDIQNALTGFFKQTCFPNGQDYSVNVKHFLNHIEIYLQAYHDKNPNIWGKKEFVSK